MGLIAIGDIHGCVATLDVLLKLLAPAQDDHLIFIGDYISMPRVSFQCLSLVSTGDEGAKRRYWDPSQWGS